MLTRRAKAYSSYWPTIEDFYRGTAIWCPRVQVSLNLEKRDLDSWNLRLMLKISYAACPCLSQSVSAQFALEMCMTSLVAKNVSLLYQWNTCFLLNISWNFCGNLDIFHEDIEQNVSGWFFWTRCMYSQLITGLPSWMQRTYTEQSKYHTRHVKPIYDFWRQNINICKRC